MAGSEGIFFKKIYLEHGGFIPTWPIGRQVKLGDLVALRRAGSFRRRRRMELRGNVTDSIIGIDIERAGARFDHTSWQSSHGVNITQKAAGVASDPDSKLPVDKAGVTIEFSKKGGFLFQPEQLAYDRIENIVSVRKQLLEKATQALLGLSEVLIVTEVAEVESYTLIISKSRSGKIEFIVGDTSGTSEGRMVDLDTNLEIAWQEDLFHQVVRAAGGPIFFKGEKVELLPDAASALRAADPLVCTLADAELLPHLWVHETDPVKRSEKLYMRGLNMDDLEEFLSDEEEE